MAKVNLRRNFIIKAIEKKSGLEEDFVVRALMKKYYNLKYVS